MKSLIDKLLGRDTDDSVMTEPGSEGKEQWILLEKVVGDAFVEQKRARQWGIFFKLLTFAYLFFGVLIFYQASGRSVPSSTDGHTAIISLKGVIKEDTQANANTFATGLRRAYEDENTKAIIIAINSPGGSPVQSDYMFNEIKRLKDKHPDIKVYAVVSDIAASGGYYVAAAADEIYANQASLVGSIGVTSAGFGFVEAIEKLGIERRDYTAGENKSFLDPFQPSKPEQVRFWQTVLASTHERFINRVKEGRGDRLGDYPDMFSGLIWNGEQALEMGLIDGFASAGQVARDIAGVEEMRDFTVKKTPLEELLGGMGTQVGKGMAEYWHGEALKMEF